MTEARASSRPLVPSFSPTLPPRAELRILLVEDSEEDAELILRELGRGGQRLLSERVETREELEAALDRGGWDVVLSDYALPRFSGTEALRLVRGRERELPFIIVSGTIGEEAAVSAMQSGAQDYVLKQGLARLWPAVQRELREAALRAERKRMQEQLLIADRMASVGILAAGVAHELNNPLAALIANLELLGRDLAAASDQIGGRQADIFSELRDATESAERMRNIVRDLKTFSRAPDEDHTAAVDVQRVMESALRVAQNEIRHRARVVRDYRSVALVQANEARLGQVFLNLLINAAQAIEEGDVDANEIAVCTREDPDGKVVVEVRDTGCGISAEAQPRIFDAFFTTKPVGVGTGLGLSICHRIVRSTGGELEVQSRQGEGTTFRVLLPRARSSALDGPPASSFRPACRAQRRGRVLVIDDEPMIATAIGRTLGLEHDVTLSSAASAALERIGRGEEFDVILCDLMMPQMTGMELYAELARSAPQQAQRIVFLSGGAFTSAARAFLDEVPNERLDKPFDTRELLALVNERTRP